MRTPIETAGDAGPAGLTDPQLRHLEQFTTRYCGRTAASKRNAALSRRVLADPPRPWDFHPCLKELCYPVVAVKACGARFNDADSNEYVDFCMDFGASLFGHNPGFVRTAIAEVLDAGFTLGPQTTMTAETAALVARITGLERVAFCSSGTEAVMVALRVARTVTARRGVAVFQDSYHGQSDEVLTVTSPHGGPHAYPLAPGIPPGAVERVIVVPYGAEEALATIRSQADQLAAVLVEPIQTRHLALAPREFLRELRRLTRAAGIALIFDELTTGFRLAPGGAQAVFQVQADLATFGKAAGGGFPLGILAGSAQYMDALDGGDWRFGDDSGPQRMTTVLASTFAKHPVSMAAARATLLRLAEYGTELLADLARQTNAVVQRLNRELTAAGAALRFESAGSCFGPPAGPEDDTLLSNRLLHYHLAERGVFLWGLAGFLSTAHTEQDLDQLVAALADSLRELNAAGFRCGCT